MSDRSIKAWIEAMRLRTLPVSVAGVLAGTACAFLYKHFNPAPALICLFFALIAQIASNFANEYYDFKNGLDKKGREGFRRGVTEGDLSPSAMKYSTFALLIFDSLLGCSLIYWGGWWLIPIGVAIALFALGYSTGPYPLSHHGLGDIAVIIFFGIVPVMLTAYLQIGDRSGWPYTLLIGVACGLLAANVLIVNNYRDAEDDRAVGKHTTVVLFGRPFMASVYSAAWLAAIIILAAVTTSFRSSWWNIAWVLIGIFYIFATYKLIRRQGAALNPVLKTTAMLMLLSCIVFLLAAIC